MSIETLSPAQLSPVGAASVSDLKLSKVQSLNRRRSLKCWVSLVPFEGFVFLLSSVQPNLQLDFLSDEDCESREK